MQDVRWGFLYVPWLSLHCQGRVCSPVVGLEALRVRFSRVSFPLSAFLAPKEVIAEANEVCAITEDLHVACAGFAQKQSKVLSFSPLCLP